MSHEATSYKVIQDQYDAGHTPSVLARVGTQIRVGHLSPRADSAGNRIVVFGDGQYEQPYAHSDLTDHNQTRLASELGDAGMHARELRERFDVDKASFKYAVTEAQLDDIRELKKHINERDDLTVAQRLLASEVINSNTVGGLEVGSSLVIRDSNDEIEQRNYIADLLTGDSEDAETAINLVESGVCGFHSTRSTAFAGILESGKIMGLADQEAVGIAGTSGERIYGAVQGQASVSFANLGKTIEVALQHTGQHGVKRMSQDELLQHYSDIVDDLKARIADEDTDAYFADRYQKLLDAYANARLQVETYPDSLLATLSRNEFPVMLGVTREFVEKEARESDRPVKTGGGSHLGEFRIGKDNGVSMSAIGIIAVPKKVMKSTRAILDKKGYSSVRVVSFESVVRSKAKV